jgi:hypothetical protein
VELVTIPHQQGELLAGQRRLGVPRHLAEDVV